MLRYLPVMKYDLIVFDLAGTTVKDNRDVHRVLQTVLRAHDVAISIDDANEVMGIPKPVAIRDLLVRRYNGSKEITTQWISDIHREFVDNMQTFYHDDPSVGEKKGVSDTFDKLKSNGIKIAVDTGFDRVVTNALLERLRWIENGLIDASVTSDEVERGRPFPDLIFEAMRRTSVREVSRVVKVGDTVSDMKQGFAAGCGLVVGVTSGAFSEADLKVENPHHLISEIPQLLPYVN